MLGASGRGEGGKTFACPLVLVAIFADGILFIHDYVMRDTMGLAAFAKGVLTATASMIFLY